MKEWSGRLEFLDLGSGGWRLTLADGQSFELFGEIAQTMNGKNVRVVGALAESHGFLMTSTQSIEVHSIHLQGVSYIELFFVVLNMFKMPSLSWS